MKKTVCHAIKYIIKRSKEDEKKQANRKAEAQAAETKGLSKNDPAWPKRPPNRVK